MKTSPSLATVVILEALLGSVAGAAENQPPAAKSKPLVTMSGADSHVTKPTYGRISDPEVWARVWVRHLGTTRDNAYRPMLEVNFDRCLVVAIFRGNQTNARGIAIESVSETKDTIVIQFSQLGYQTYQPSDFDDEYKKTDRLYAFVVVPKTSKSIVLEENVQYLLNHPPVWKECARLEAGRTTRKQNVKE